MENFYDDEDEFSNEEEIDVLNYGEWLDFYEDEFSNTIKCRGEDYYNNGKVVNCYKVGNNKFIGYVDGSLDKPYKVNVEVDLDSLLIYFDCTCPCEFHCKHEYAVLMAINNYEFSDVLLKPYIKEDNENLKNIIEKIPAQEIKDYLLLPDFENYVCFEINHFKNHFKKYMPKLSHTYYYNNLYNSLVLDECYEDNVECYLMEIRKFINCFAFEEAFKIIKAIINAYVDSGRISTNEYLISQMPTLGMYIRVINRKGNDDLKLKISKWFVYLESNNYFDNLYLEDAIEISK